MSPERGGGTPPSRVFTYTELFEQQCPIYMAMGMSYSDFWDGDCSMVIAYRKANELVKEQQNEMMWLQGLYIRDAIWTAVPVDKGKKPYQYPKEPIPITQHGLQETERRKREDENKQFMAFMNDWTNAVNAEFGIKPEKG